jgi:hypothetical protein
MTQILSPADLGLWRFGVGQYHQMIAQGILDTQDHVELLEPLIGAVPYLVRPLDRWGLADSSEGRK